MPIVGWIIGYFIDGSSGSATKNWGVLIGAFVGVGAAIFMIQRAATRDK
jgi:F0F1-type ATP synthase assembly protein I